MPKKVFWPVALIVMGLLFLTANLRILPQEFWNLWPLLLIVVGLGGLLTADRDEWLYEKKSGGSRKKSSSSRKSSAKKTKKSTKRKK